MKLQIKLGPCYYISTRSLKSQKAKALFALWPLRCNYGLFIIMTCIILLSI